LIRSQDDPRRPQTQKISAFKTADHSAPVRRVFHPPSAPAQSPFARKGAKISPNAGRRQSMRRLAPTIIGTFLSLANHPARADFVIKTDPAPGKVASATESTLGVVADQPHVDPGDRRPARKPVRTIVQPRPVEGFGDRVPLSFACRQIVPAQIKVSYGSGVDPGTPVTWTGGDAWSLVLRRAIEPLGFHMVAAGTTLQITE
jgi:hypothetical protein